MNPHETPCDESTAKGVVLVVDDHPINRLLMETMLSKDRWQVALAQSADDAMDMLDQGLRPSLIFMDIRLTHGDGFGATRRIRQWELSLNLGPVPIVALTADVLEETKIRAAKAGMNGFLAKPVTHEQIRRAIAAVLPR